MTDQNTAVMIVEFGLTKQAEAYTSIRVGGSMPVFVTPDTDLEHAFSDALTIIREKAQAEVDAEFESVGQPAPYSTEQRGRLLVLSGDAIAIILPVHITDHVLPEPWQRISDRMAGHRINYIRAKTALEYAQSHIIIDCADGDLSKLPELEFAWLYTNSSLKVAVLTTDNKKLPEDLKIQAASWWSSNSRIGLPASNSGWAEGKAEADGISTLLDCRDGNFEPVSEFYQEHVAKIVDETEEPEEPEEDADGYDYDEDEDYDDEDYDDDDD